MEKKDAKIVVERETFEKNGKTYFSYFIKGKIRGKDVRILIKGNATNLRGKASGILPIGAYGITANVPAEAWEQIKNNYRDDARIKNGLIFARTPSKARKEAKERKDLRNGFEPIDPEKMMKTKPNEG